MTCYQRKDQRYLSNHLDTYLSAFRDDALLSAEEERSLAEAIRRGDLEARNRMVRCNVRLVIKIARDFRGRGLSLEDLVSEGNLGLIHAAKKFDPQYSTRFSTYAAHWIRQAIREALVNTTATIRLPAHMENFLNHRWRKVEQDLSRDLGFAPSFDQVAEAMDLSEAKRMMVAQALDARRLCGEGTDEYGETWSCDEAPDFSEPPEAALEAEEEREFLLQRLDQLDARERSVIAMRYGLGGRTPLKLKEIGRRLGVTREWVRRIEAKAMLKLAAANHDDHDDDDEDTFLERPRTSRTRSRAAVLQMA